MPRILAKVLRRLGFEVFDGYDLDRVSMRDTLLRFARAAQTADTALAYYAGHGLQYRGENYLVPVDAKLQDEIDLDFQTVQVEDVLRALERARGTRILILDACRNLPLVGGRSSFDVFATRGLAKIGRRGMVIAYSTQADEVAFDGTGRNSVFTGALVREIEQPNSRDRPAFPTRRGERQSRIRRQADAGTLALPDAGLLLQPRRDRS